MSIDLYLFTEKTPSRSQIDRVIEPLGFRRREEVPERYNWYFWFEEENVASLRGCHLYWERHAPKAELWPGMPKKTRTAFTANTKVGRSYEDIEQQNNVIRALRQRFGGSIYEEWSGKRGYVENDVPRLSYPEKRCGLVVYQAHNALVRAHFLPSEESADELSQAEALRRAFGMEWASNAVIRNNTLLVFLVAILEDFLRSLFVAYLDSQPEILEQVYERQGRIEYGAIRTLLTGETSLAELEAGNFNFQNLESANAAYERYFDINLFKVWSRKKRFGRKYHNIRELLGNLIALRHRVVHEAYIDPELRAEETKDYIAGVEYGVKMLVEALETEKGFRIDLDKRG